MTTIIATTIIPIVNIVSCSSQSMPTPIKVVKTKFIDNIEYNLALQAPDAKIKNIILFGIDGLGGEFLLNKNFFNKIIQNSFYTFQSKNVLPTSSAPNWSTIFTGTTNLHHGYFEWRGIKPEWPPVIVNEFNRYPTIFYLLKKFKTISKVGLYIRWANFMNLIETSIVDHIYDDMTSDENTVLKATEYFIKEKPDLLLITQINVDNAGHAHKYGSSKYYEEIKKIETNLNSMINKIKIAKMLDQTLIIITSDHGGHNTQHGYGGHSPILPVDHSTAPLFKNVPLIFYNPHLKTKGQIKQPVFNWDIAPTIARIFGLHVPKIGVGQNIEEVEFIDHTLKNKLIIKNKNE